MDGSLLSISTNTASDTSPDLQPHRSRPSENLLSQWIVEICSQTESRGAVIFVHDSYRKVLTATDIFTGDLQVTRGLLGVELPATSQAGSLWEAIVDRTVIGSPIEHGDAVTRQAITSMGAPLLCVVPIGFPEQAPLAALALFGDRTPDTEPLLDSAVFIAAALHQRVGREPRDEEIEQALSSGQIQPYFQSFTDLATGNSTGAEALARWVREDGSVVSPADFLPRIERSGLTEELTAVMLAQATAHVAHWVNAGYVGEDFQLAVNLTMPDATSGRLTTVVDEVLGHNGLAPSQLCLELTESEAMSKEGSLLETLTKLRERDISIALDDFGTGYSSLAWLGRLPIDIVKIDRSFVGSLPDDRGAEAVIVAVLQVAQARGLQVTAEGIETREQADALQKSGINLGQGYLYGRPSAPAEFLVKLSQEL